VTGQDPDVLLSYTPFSEHEKTVKANFPNVPHFNLDAPDVPSASGEVYSQAKYQDLDFLQALCPCAGLSMMSNGSAEQRASMNAWMLKTAEHVTKNLRPKVFWGENAPTLYTARGAEIRGQFQEFADATGYSLSFYHTDTIFHGVPQNRRRTFYFFWRDTPAPVMGYYKRPHKNLIQYLKEIPKGITGHTKADLKKAKEDLFANPYMQFLRDKYQGKGLDHMRQVLAEKGLHTMTLIRYMFVTDQWGEARAYFVKNNMERQIREIDRIKSRTDSGYGVWDGSMSLFRADGEFSAMIGRKLNSIHPIEDRCITQREVMHLMALPNDFVLATENLNHICQNVPVCTGSDMTTEVVEYLKGNRPSSGARLLKQSNVHERVEESQSGLLTF
jgi:site-specific DNA-cytosine methylase